MADGDLTITPPILARRDFRLTPRTAQDSATLATVTADDVAHAKRTARDVCTSTYNRYLGAQLDERAINQPESDA